MKFVHVFTHLKRFAVILRPVVKIGAYRVFLSFMNFISQDILQRDLGLLGRLNSFYWLGQRNLSLEDRLCDTVESGGCDLCDDS